MVTLEASYIDSVRPSLVICVSPVSDCSSSRKRPSPASHSRPLAPLRSGLPAIVPLGKRWLVKVMRALNPATGLECRAAFRAEASERGGGLGPEPLDASAIPVASTAAIGRRVTAISLGVERRRRRFISCYPGIGWPQSGSPCLKDP